MVRMRMISILIAIVALGAGSALAAVVYEADLMPELVMPGSGASAYGQATLIVNDAGTLADLTLNFAGLDTPQTAAKLLVGPNDQPGDVLEPLPTGTPLALTFEFTAEMDVALENDELAIQVYSEAWPNGAIRGNFTFVIVGVDAATWSQVKNLFD